MHFPVIRVALVAVLALSSASLGGCSYSSSHKTSGTTTSSQTQDSYDSSSKPQPKPKTLPDPEPEAEIAPRYEDERWPTTNKQLLAIPKSQRWYNAAKHVGSTCTIAGPVVNVYQAKEASGMPIFVNIGTAYPSSDCVTLLIWADQLDDFEEMLNAVDDGDAWLSVTGYLSSYNGSMQFNIDDGPVEYTWWTNVR
ncbi:MAG: hypothetical protein UCH28_03555 [Adlercreutzia sp.]|nr:hypothetical protein [Adlercreutzia sp.]